MTATERWMIQTNIPIEKRIAIKTRCVELGITVGQAVEISLCRWLAAEQRKKLKDSFSLGDK